MPLKNVLSNEFKPLTEETLEQVWHWRNLPHIRMNMHNDTLISWSEHLAWFERLKHDTSKKYYVLWQNERPVGALNFSSISSSSLEWGCFIGEQHVWPGTGLLIEIAALDYALKQGFISTLKAEVLSFNINVLKMHRFFEYKEKETQLNRGIRNDKPYDVITFEYDLQDWQNKRESVLTKLPKQIREAAAQITFQY